jgi:hypothetical protein
LIPKKLPSSGNLGVLGLASEDGVGFVKKNGFLKRKFSFSQSLHDIIFPSFLNDKAKLALQVSNNAQSTEKQEEGSQPTSEIFDEEKPMKKGNVVKAKKCLKGKVDLISDFDQGLFNQKIDVNNDDFMTDFLTASVENPLSNLENEIKSALFNEVPEDFFFELE